MTERRQDDRATLNFPESARGTSSSTATSSASRPGTGLRQLRTTSHSPVDVRLPTRTTRHTQRSEPRRLTSIQAEQARIRSALFQDPHSQNSASANSQPILAEHELVRLENPRPNILRVSNNYVVVPTSSNTPSSLNLESSTSVDNSVQSQSTHASVNSNRTESKSRSTKCGRSNRRAQSHRSPSHFHKNSDPEKVLLSFDKPDSSQQKSSGISFDFDRAKVHVKNTNRSLSQKGSTSDSRTLDSHGLGELRPLVRNGNANTNQRPFRDNSVALPQRTSSLAINRTPSENVIGQEPGPTGLRRNASLSTRPRFGVGPSSSGVGLSQSAPSTLLSSTSFTTTGSRRCPDCGKCRCSACRTPRVLPSYWFCDNSCLCSAESVTDTLSCMCCVRGCLYHCHQTLRDWSPDDPGGADGGPRDETPVDLSDEALCRCGDQSPLESCARWACLGLGCLFLPCLWCYLPMKACAEMCNYCYARHHFRGCRCPSTQTSDRWGTHGQVQPLVVTRQPSRAAGRGNSIGFQTPASDEDQKLHSKLKLLEQQ